MNISVMWRTACWDLRLHKPLANKKGKICGRGFGLEDLVERMTGISRRTDLACGDMEKEGILW